MSMDTTTYTVADYVRGTEHADPQRQNITNRKLVVDKEKLLIFYVEDGDIKQARIDLFSNMGMRMLEQAMRQQSDDIRAVFDSEVPATRTLAYTTTAAAWGTQAHIDKVTDAILRMGESTDKWFWNQTTSVNGGGTKYMVIPPEIKKFLVEDLVKKGVLFVSGLSDRARTDYEIANVYGFMPIVDAGISNSLSAGHTVTNTDDDNFKMYFGIVGNGLAFVEQMANVETFRSHEHVGTAIRILYMYGTKASDADKLALIQPSITA